MLNRLRRLGFFTAALSILLPNAALAYIGPGAGLGAIAITIALVLGVVLLFVGLVWYPLKRFLNRNKHGSLGSDRKDHSK